MTKSLATVGPQVAGQKSDDASRVDLGRELGREPGTVRIPGDESTTTSEKLRAELVAEIESMVLFLLSEGSDIGPEATETLERLDSADLGLAELVTTHSALAALCPAKPRVIRALHEGRANHQTGAAILGPTPIVRRLSVVSILFAILFFGTSLSGAINVETVKSSIYELDGLALATKLVLVMSAAGLGASFAVLFDVWSDLSNNRFDPLSESANWMRIGLGIVAGMILAEIVSSERVLTEQSEVADVPLISGPLLALIGGFSATVLHMIMTSIVDAFRRAFSPDRNQIDHRAVEMIAGRIISATVQKPETTPPAIIESPKTSAQIDGTADEVGETSAREK